jgi:hypothetical protein
LAALQGSYIINSMRNKYFLTSLVGVFAVGLIAPGLVLAADVTTEALKLQVDALIIQVEKLQSDLNAAQTQQGLTPTPIFTATEPKSAPTIKDVVPLPTAPPYIPPVPPPPPPSQGALNASTPTVQPSVPLPTTPPLPSNKFTVGDRVRTIDYLNIRTSPSGNTLAVAPPGALGTITGGRLVMMQKKS